MLDGLFGALINMYVFYIFFKFLQKTGNHLLNQKTLKQDEKAKNEKDMIDEINAKKDLSESSSIIVDNQDKPLFIDQDPYHSDLKFEENKDIYSDKANHKLLDDRRDSKDPKSLNSWQRAIIMKEILDKPVSMRNT